MSRINDQYEKYHTRMIPPGLQKRKLFQLSEMELSRLDTALRDGVTIRQCIARFNLVANGVVTRRKQLGLS